MLNHLLVVVAEDPQHVAARVKLATLYVLGRAYALAAEQAAAVTELAPDDPDVIVLNARLLLQQDDSAGGMAAIDRALDIDPNHIEALGMKALDLQEDQPDRALDLLDEAIGRLSSDETRPLRELKLNILARHERTQGLEQALLAMIGDAPEDDSRYQARLARFYQEQGQLDKAEAMLRDIAVAASGDVGATLDVVQFLAETRTPETATEALQAFIDEDPENQQLLIVLGDRYLIDDRRDEAVAIYTEAAAIDSTSKFGLLARVRLVAERIRNGDTDAAKKQVDGILTDAPALSDALLIRAGLLFTEQRYDDAIADLRILLRKEAKNQRALLLMGRSEAATGSLVLSKDAYRRLLGVNPRHRVAARELVNLMIQADQFDEAETLFNRLTAEDSGNVEAGILLIELQVLQEDWEAAAAEARRVGAGDDPNGVGPFMLGQVLEGQQRYAEAIEAFSQALEKSPENISILQGLARSLNAQGKEDETIALLRRSVAEYPDNPGIRLMLGGALKDQGETAEALQVFESLIGDHPGLSPAYVAVASLYPDDATRRIAAYRRGLTAVPANLPLGRLLADEYQRLGRSDELIDLYNELLAVHPETLEIANNLAVMLADLRYQDAASLERAVELADSLAGSDEPAVMDTVGWVYYRSGDSERAVPYLERAVAELAEIPVVHYHLGMAYLAAGNRVGAQQELEKALQLSAGTDFDGIEETREALATL